MDTEEPMHLAEAVKKLNLNHVVITSVTRDDLPDGGAAHFAKTIEAVRNLNPNTTIEVLIPDLKGVHENLDIVINANPDVILIKLGKIEYDEAYKIQQEIVKLRQNGIIDDTLLLLEHFPFLTVGRSGDDHNIIVLQEMLKENHVNINYVNRGGDVLLTKY